MKLVKKMLLTKTISLSGDNGKNIIDMDQFQCYFLEILLTLIKLNNPSLQARKSWRFQF